MGLGSWLLFFALAALAGGYAGFLYSRREVRVLGRAPLAVLRATTLALILLLLFDPTLPGLDRAPGQSRDWVLVDGSLSMEAPGSDGSLWEAALDRALTGPTAGVRVFGDGVRPLDPEARELPGYARSRVTEALERAAESGARTVRLISDLRFEDPVAARNAVARLGLRLVVESLGDSVRSAGIEAFRIPGAVRAGEAIDAEVTLFGAGSAGDSATLRILEEGRAVTSVRVLLPPAGGLARVGVTLPPPVDTATVRYTARVELAGDVFAADDERVAYTTVDPVEGNLVVVSLDADWEVRFLLPVLERVTGLPSRGFIRVGEDRFLAMAPGGAAGTVDAASVAARAAGAELLVLQGAATEGGASWALEAALRARRAILLPGTREGARALGLDVGPPRPGEWYASTELPPSPLAGELAPADIRTLPPVSGVLPLTGEAPGFVPIELRLRGAGPGQAALILRAPKDGRRQAVALARGFWRWAFRTPAGRDTYERLWAGVAGWLLAEQPLARGPGLRPQDPVVGRGEAVVWGAAGHAGATVELTVLPDGAAPAGLTRATGSAPALDTTVTVPEGGRFRTPALPPGAYRYRARIGDGGAEVETDGRFDVEAYTDELLHQPMTGLDTAGDHGAAGVGSPAPGFPLRTHPLPYLVLLALLCAEWIGRRRRGLR